VRKVRWSKKLAQSIFIVCLLVLAVLAWGRPPLAAALVLLLFPIKIIGQSSGEWLRSASLGTVFVNIVIALIATIAAFGQFRRKSSPLTGMMNAVWVSCMMLFGWSVCTLAWSPALEEGTQTVISQWPYLMIAVVIGPVLIADAEDLAEMWLWLQLIGIACCNYMAASPDFSMRHGRLGFDLTSDRLGRVNALAVGEVGGITLISGILARPASYSQVTLLIRLTAVVTGALVAILSGSRGQAVFAVVVAVILFPYTAPMRNLRTYIVAALAVGTAALTAWIVMTSVLNTWEANRFSVDSLVYGASSSSSRLASVADLATAWANSPSAWIIGLGYYAYHGLQPTEIYSHVLFADAIFELGVIGFTLLLITLFGATASAVRLLRDTRDEPAQRACYAFLIALACYYTLIVNKQGYLWGSMWFFFLLILVRRVDARRKLRSDSV